jgi:hypothetical protein
MNLGRIGHYFVSSNSEDEELAGSCRTAIVTQVYEKADGSEQVSLAVWNYGGESDGHLHVDVAAPRAGTATFHLNQECPWNR